eukprot:CAMPEP_0174268314 /NCGR_PEP_ID=MMETSP0439-20130205/36996_1 /TAXON_ID=0 /ORGANISM="Stereomyxa ramosa, Strain Chinc5" /LENGTH=170 /DNA_ID=CAMNT_0015356409 /DNA_START=439 /DNA_END=951 /DNA_ORIENTATION=-
MNLNYILQKLKDQRAKNLVVLNVGKKCDWTDYMIIAEGRSGKHIKSLGQSLIVEMKSRQGRKGVLSGIDANSNDWIVVQCGSSVVHLLSAKARKYYDLESLWILRKDMSELQKMSVEDQQKEYETILAVKDIDDEEDGWSPFDNVKATVDPSEFKYLSDFDDVAVQSSKK